MLDETTIEQRLIILEHTVADLKRQIGSTSAASTWLDKITGSISDEAAFLQALEYGQSIRYADRPENGSDRAL